MEDNAKLLTRQVFEIIENSKSEKDLDKFDSLNFSEPIKKFYTRTNRNYPKIQFTFTEDDIKKLKKGFPDFETDKFTDPFVKLFYAMLWKQGDLPKLKHLIEGLENKDKKDCNALVLYNFGRYLSDNENNPIIDQHVIRAFKAGQDIGNFEKHRKINFLEKIEHKEYIDEYRIWLQKLRTKIKKEDWADFLFKLDRILMTLGKAIKSK